MDTLSSVGEGYVTGLLDLVDRAGVSRQDLVRHAGLKGLESGSLTRRLPMGDVIALFDAAVDLTGRADLGLEFGRCVRPGTFSVLGYALMTCKNLGEAIALVPRYRRLVFDLGYSEMRLSITAQEARLAWHVVSRSLPYSRCLAESLIAAWYAYGRWMTGVDLPLLEVRFMHGAPADVQSYARYFECPVRFGAAQNVLVFSRALLDMPLVQADESLHLVMRAQALAAMEKAFHHQDPAQRLRQALLPLMPKCEATLEKAAQVLGLSPRSLQRQLAERGQRFQEVLDAVRQDLGRVYLRDPGLSVLDVALLLGYAEQSSFTRAFRAWFGLPPLRWRRGLRSPRDESP